MAVERHANSASPLPSLVDGANHIMALTEVSMPYRLTRFSPSNPNRRRPDHSIASGTLAFGGGKASSSALRSSGVSVRSIAARLSRT